MIHQWMEGNLISGSRCAQCDKLCGVSRTSPSWRCLWCHQTVRVFTWNVTWHVKSRVSTWNVTWHVKTRVTTWHVVWHVKTRVFHVAHRMTRQITFFTWHVALHFKRRVSTWHVAWYVKHVLYTWVLMNCNVSHLICWIVRRIRITWNCFRFTKDAEVWLVVTVIWDHRETPSCLLSTCQWQIP